MESFTKDNNSCSLDYSIKTESTTKVQFIFENSEKEIYDLTLSFTKFSKILILTEEKIYNIYKDYLESIFNKETYMKNLHLHFVEEGDFFKTSDTIEDIQSLMFSLNFDRSSLVVGFGGGKISDLAGYLSSIFLRGVALVLIPTTLLAMVDATIGGKTAINSLKHGKNLIGTIYQPQMIVINLFFLHELNEDLLSDGMSEIIKIFALFDQVYFEKLKHISLKDLINPNYRNEFYDIVIKAVYYKIEVIKKDSSDKNLRNVLNFGHTIGHAIESLEALNLSHGKSVAIGLCTEVEIACYLNLTEQNSLRSIKEVLENFNLPTTIPKYLDPFQIIEKIKSDKKNADRKSKIVVIDKIGILRSPNTITLEFDFLKKFLAKSVIIKYLPREVNKVVKLKGSKSICNRALMLAAMGSGDILLRNFLFSEDTMVMIKCLKNMGVEISILDDSTLKVIGKGGDNFENLKTSLHVENAGTAARFLVGLCAITKNSEILIDGNSRMRDRPIEDLLECLPILGIEVEYLLEENRMPFKIKTKKAHIEDDQIKQIQIKSKKSSQFVTSLLLASPYFTSDRVEIILSDINEGEMPVSFQYIDMTIKMMKVWGIEVLVECYNKYKIYRRNNSLNQDMDETESRIKYINPQIYSIEPDASTANYYFTFIALTGGEVTLEGIGSSSIQGDSKFVNILEQMLPGKFSIDQGENYTTFTNKVNFDIVKSNNNKSINIDCAIITDSFLALCTICAHYPSRYILTGLANQAIKECNRLECITVNLSKIGVICSILPNSDGVEIKSYLGRRNANIPLITINTEDDHRIAMTFSIYACVLKNSKILIDNKNCVDKTYPEFWKDFEELGLSYQSQEFNFNKSIFKLNRENFRNSIVFLIGMRSCGKSTFGKFAAEKLDLKFFDMDLMLIEKYKNEYSCIDEIVNKKGWAYFRSLETSLYYDIFLNENFFYTGSIIACGGGIVENEGLLQAMKSFGLVIFIDTHLDNIKQIISIKKQDVSSHNRPQYIQPFDEVYLSRYEKYKYCSNYTFTTPYLKNSDLENNFDLTLSKLNTLFLQFIFNTCNISKFPLATDNSFFLSLMIEEESLEASLTKLKNLPNLYEYSAIEIRADKFIQNFLSNYETDNSISNAMQKLVKRISEIVSLIRFSCSTISNEMPIIFTIRSESQGGFFNHSKFYKFKFADPFKIYNEINLSMLKYGIEYFDIEYERENISFIEKFYSISNSRVILSRHYTKSDHKLEEMKKDIYTMSLLNKDVIKIITNIRNTNAYHKIRNFIFETIPGYVIHFQLGESGKYTRVFNSFLNPVYDEAFVATGKGQMTKKEIINIQKQLGIYENELNYYVLGSNVNLSPSPQLYKWAFEHVNIQNKKMNFERKNLPTEKEYLYFIETSQFTFANVTIPYKGSIFTSKNRPRDVISEEGQYIKAINLIKIANKQTQSLFMCNTDWLATYEIILEILPIIKKSFDEIKILILGAGGAAVSTILPLVLIPFDKKNIHIKNRTQKRVEELYKKFEIGQTNQSLEMENKIFTYDIFDIVISSIPKDADLSFCEKSLEIPFITNKTFIIDLSYSKDETNIRKKTKEITSNYIDGLEFLLRQAYYNFEIFSGGYVAPRKVLKTKLYNQFYC